MLASAIVSSPYDAPGAPGGPDLFIKISEFHQAFCADLPASVAAAMAVSQRPLSVAALTETATTAGWKNLPSWYMVSERDNAIQPDCERYMARRMNASVESVSNGSHAAFIARPDIAASLILKAIETTWG
jgi:pimeloyl-ACP methyl ester carboxylesterase